ncbi:MAG: hypothetical protein ACR2IL_07020 [Chitinophagaceae bacterium]
MYFQWTILNRYLRKMENKEQSKPIQQLTPEQEQEIMQYEEHWRPTLEEAALRGESIKETYEKLRPLEDLM